MNNRMSFSSSCSTSSFPKAESPTEARFVVVTDPTDMRAYSISFRYVLPTIGLQRVLTFLEQNTTRKHKKHIQTALCDSVALGTVCPFGQQCPNIHTTREGYAKRRIWDRPLTLQRLASVRARRMADRMAESYPQSSADVSLSCSTVSSLFVPDFCQTTCSTANNEMPMMSTPMMTSVSITSTELGLPTVFVSSTPVVQQSGYGPALTEYDGFVSCATNAQCMFTQSENLRGDIVNSGSLFRQAVVSHNNVGDLPTFDAYAPKTPFPLPSKLRAEARAYRPPMGPTTQTHQPRLLLSTTTICNVSATSSSDDGQQPSTPVESVHSSIHSHQSVSPESSPAPLVPFTHSPYEPIASLSLFHQHHLRQCGPLKEVKNVAGGLGAIQSRTSGSDTSDDADFVWADVHPDEKMDFPPDAIMSLNFKE